MPKDAEFQWMIGVILITALYCTLCEDTVAELAGVRPNLIWKWVDDLGSLLYRDEGANGAIRVWHLSISDFFINNDCCCDYQVNIMETNLHLRLTCLTMMIDQLALFQYLQAWRFLSCKCGCERFAILNQTEYFWLVAIQFSLLVKSSLPGSQHWWSACVGVLEGSIIWRSVSDILDWSTEHYGNGPDWCPKPLKSDIMGQGEYCPPDATLS